LKTGFALTRIGRVDAEWFLHSALQITTCSIRAGKGKTRFQNLSKLYGTLEVEL